MANLSQRLRANALRVIADLIEAGIGVDGEVSASATDDGIEVSVIVRSTGARGESATLPAHRLTPLQKQIVALLADGRTLKAASIALKLGKRCGGSFRSTLADLVRLGVLLKVPGGYRVP